MSDTIETDFVGIRGIERTTLEFREKLRGVASRIGASPRDLATVMSFESGGTFSPSVRNAAGSGATGLIQFMPSTARGLGTSTSALARMSAVEQLDYVERYFAPYKGHLGTAHDLYMAVLWPKAVGRGPDHVLFRKGDRNFRQNAGLDHDRDGLVLAREASAAMLRGGGSGTATSTRGRRSRSSNENTGETRERLRRSDAARARDGLAGIYHVPVPSADGRAASASTNARAPISDDGNAIPASATSEGIVSAIAGLFTLAAEHYRVDDPDLAARYATIASTISAISQTDGPVSGRESTAGLENRPHDLGLVLAPS